MAYELDRKRTDRVSKKIIVEELQQVAKHYGYTGFTCEEFNRVATRCKHTTVLRAFHTWERALVAVGVDRKTRPRTRRDRIPDERIVSEMERIWKLVGQRPSKAQWEQSNPRYSYGGVYKHFGGWTKACLAFIEYKSGISIAPEHHTEGRAALNPATMESRAEAVSRDKRDIPLKLRLEVLKRDQFKCVYCGRSPAINAGVTLHIDHVVPVSKGGETKSGNLQSLCQDCNWGKADR